MSDTPDEGAEIGLIYCPFCGKVPELSKHFREDQWQMIHRCRVIGPIVIEWGSMERVISRWNTRALVDLGTDV